ncbi:MAG: Glu-tRNA(Gln) amidotransferase subunit GatE [Candidatus Coatesbacteria bacterium]|nr:Glu-tRNA(Gln) amidotransferase subunit GatE [Candidatus Coatesbacteria bacterium]
MKVEYLSDEEYQKLGLTSGIEIHQQIKTDKKLFCRCPVILHKDNNFDAVVVRHMRPTLSELGEYDGTALMEFKTKKEVVYQLYHDCVCTYEMDDTPPFLINQDAVDIAIAIAMLLGCTQIDEIFITRKQYLDGSIPTGFQRTCIVGIDGEIRCKGKPIHIRQLGLEEDACREVSDIGHRITYKADRLGMPLIEVVTERDMVTPREVQDVAEQIGTCIKAAGLAHRGSGSVRQDVNVSINGSTRVEIKGVPRVGLIGPLVHYEALRQKHLLEIRDELKSRGVTKENLKFWTLDVTEMMDELGSGVIIEHLDVGPGNRIVAMGLGKFGGLLRKELQPDKTFGYEISQRIMVIACLDGEPNIMWDDGAKRTGDINNEPWERLFTALEASSDDAVILVWGNKADVKTAVEETRLRLEDAIDGVPNETRQAKPDGTTGFERILPGPDRMYPDTDLPPFAIPIERFERIERSAGPNPFNAFERFRDMGIPDNSIKQMMRNGRWLLFDRIIGELDVDPQFVAEVLSERLRWLERAGFDVSGILDDQIFELLRAFGDGKLSRESVPLAMRDSLALDDPIEDVLKRYEMKDGHDASLGDLVATAVADGKHILNALPEEKAFNALMGEVMRNSPVRLEPREVAEVLRTALSKVDEPT